MNPRAQNFYEPETPKKELNTRHKQKKENLTQAPKFRWI